VPENDTKLDGLMNLLTASPGWAEFQEAILVKQRAAHEKLLRAVDTTLPLEKVYALISEVNAFARTLGIPAELSNRAIEARKAEADGKKKTPTGAARPSATARARSTRV
jgi:hypothetical protein